MRSILLVLAASSLFAQAPVPAAGDNAVEAQKKRFDENFRQKYPLWPQTLAPKKRQAKPVVLPPLRRPELRDAPNPKVPVPKSQALVRGDGPCAIPLRNALRPGDKVPNMPHYKPPRAPFPMKEVQVPAPSCDDVGRR